MSGDSASGELHEVTEGGERVLIRRGRPEDAALYPAFLGKVGADDLRLRFFAHIAELSAAEIDYLAHLNYGHEMALIALDEHTGDMLGLGRLKGELDQKTAECGNVIRTGLKGSRAWLVANAAHHRLCERKRSEAHLWRCVGRKHDHAANVRRTRLPRNGYGSGFHTCCARSKKCRRSIESGPLIEISTPDVEPLSALSGALGTRATSALAPLLGHV